MKLKLIDVITDVHEVETGTCELCFSTTTASDPVYVFEKQDTKEKFEVEGYDWDWGDYSEVLVDNIIDFAEYVSACEFTSDQVFNFGWLDQLAYDYYDSKQEDGE